MLSEVFHAEEVGDRYFGTEQRSYIYIYVWIYKYNYVHLHYYILILYYYIYKTYSDKIPLVCYSHKNVTTINLFANSLYNLSISFGSLSRNCCEMLCDGF